MHRLSNLLKNVRLTEKIPSTLETFPKLMGRLKYNEELLPVASPLHNRLSLLAELKYGKFKGVAFI